MKKSELKQMICEVLREELAKTKRPLKESADGWYGADSEAEFDTSVYPELAKYFGLDSACKVLYAYWFMDEVTVEYEDASGKWQQIDEHVPLHQVEEWFKAGYTLA